MIKIETQNGCTRTEVCGTLKELVADTMVVINVLVKEIPKNVPEDVRNVYLLRVIMALGSTIEDMEEDKE